MTEPFRPGDRADEDEAWFVPGPLDVRFEGFTAKAFDLLAGLRRQPHIERYRADKDALARAVQGPFRAYRDDLVVNWVLPNRLNFETERNVFSRFLKNDFGAGGCHDRLWMAFYRPGTSRLKDLQLVHAVDPDGFAVSLFAGSNAPLVLKAAQQRIGAEPEAFRAMVDRILDDPGWRFVCYEKGAGPARDVTVFSAREIEALTTAEAFWVKRRLPRADVCRLGPGLVAWSIHTLRELWPLYRFLLSPFSSAI